MKYFIKILKKGLLSVLLFAVLPAYCLIQNDAVSSIDPGDNIKYNDAIPQLQFAATEIQNAFIETEKNDLTVELIIGSNESSSAEGFEIKSDGKMITVIGTDPSGAMYGGIQIQ